MELFNSNTGCFFAGTVLAGTPSGPGIDPSGPQRGDDIINVVNFLDSNTFSLLALAEAPRYQQQINWRQPVQCVLDKFPQSVTAMVRTKSGGNRAIRLELFILGVIFYPSRVER